MISVNNLSVIYGDRKLFDKMAFYVSPKDKIGLVGKNGAGKSTLLKTVIGEQLPTSGDVSIPNDYIIGYLPQEMKHNEHNTIIEEASLAFSEINVMQERIDAITEELNVRTDYQTDSYANLIQELNEINDRLNILDIDHMTEKIERILKGLGFTNRDMNQPMNTFSGGWKMRVELAKMLLQEPNLLLLEEPTNHLDIESIQWLEDFLTASSSSIMLISHDRDFLDNITNRTIEISKGKIYDYKFPYSKYLVQRKDELEKQKAAYKNQQKYIADTEILINKFRAKKNKASFAQSLIKKLDKLERIEIDDFDTTKINIKFPPAPHAGKMVVEAHNLAKTFDDKKVFENVNFLVPRQQKLALVGKNGAGKTTLIKILTGQLKAEGDFKLGHQVTIGYFAQDEAHKLDENKTVFEVIDDVAVGAIRTQIRGILGSFLFGGDDIDKKVKVLSGGEKTRLALCKLLLDPVNLLILDEPTNHLDLKSKEVLKDALLKYDGTMIIVSHDRNFLHGLVKNIYEIQPTGLKHYIGDIYDFLKEKQAKSIAQFETVAKKKKVEKENDSSEKLNYKERKALDKEKRRLTNKVRRCVNEIEELEEKIKEMNDTIANLDYSDQTQADLILKNYGDLKTRLDEVVVDWENAENELGKFTE